MIRVENINTLMSLALFFDPSAIYLTRPVRVASQTLVCSFFCAVGQLFRETRVLITVFGLSLVSTSVEHTCFRNVEPCPLFFCLLCTSCGIPPSLCCLSSVHKSRSVVKLHWCPQNRFKSCPFVKPIRKSAALFASFIVILFGVVLRILVYRTVPAW